MERINYKGYHATWFPLEQAYIIFKDGVYQPLSDTVSRDMVESTIDKLISKRYVYIHQFKTRQEAVKFLTAVTGDKGYEKERLRNYEIVNIAISDGFIINIDEDCPINGFKSGYKDMEALLTFIKENVIEDGKLIWAEEFDWLYEELKHKL